MLLLGSVADLIHNIFFGFRGLLLFLLHFLLLSLFWLVLGTFRLLPFLRKQLWPVFGSPVDAFLVLSPEVAILKG